MANVIKSALEKGSSPSHATFPFSPATSRAPRLRSRPRQKFRTRPKLSTRTRFRKRPKSRMRSRSQRRPFTKKAKLRRRPVSFKLSLMNLSYSTEEVAQLKRIMQDMLFLIRVGELDLDSMVPKEVLRSQMNLNLHILEYDLPGGFVRYQIDFHLPDQVQSTKFTFQVAKVLNPTEQKVLRT